MHLLHKHMIVQMKCTVQIKSLFSVDECLSSQAVTQMSISTTPGMKLPSYVSTPRTNILATVTEIPDLSSVTSGSEPEAR